jgi:hypothetical protein
MNNLRLRLMHSEALQRLRDAHTLSEAMGFVEQSDSPYLLRLLGLELLLKLVFESSLCKRAHGHKYERLFSQLPGHLQARLLLLAGERIGRSTLTENHAAVFKEWGQNFVALRYPWERYKSLSEEQYANLGKEWAARGYPLEGARFLYYPEELFGILTALQVVTDELLGASHDGR